MVMMSFGFDMNNLGSELGYEIELKSWDFFDFELDYERDDNKYFATNGRKLESYKGNKDGKKKEGLF